MPPEYQTEFDPEEPIEEEEEEEEEEDSDDEKEESDFGVCPRCGDRLGGENFVLELYDHAPGMSFGGFLVRDAVNADHPPTDNPPLFEGCVVCLEREVGGPLPRALAKATLAYLWDQYEEEGGPAGATIELHI